MNLRVVPSSKRLTSKHKDRTIAIGLFCVVVIIGFGSIISNRLVFHSPAVRVWFFDVGQGDAMMIETKSGKQILIDAGPDDSILTKLSEVMWPWDRKIDPIVFTHPDADHIAGAAEILTRYSVGHVYETGALSESSIARMINQEQAQENISTTFVREGDSLRFDDVVLDVMWPRDIDVVHATNDRNNSSIVIRLVYGQTSILFTGDAEEFSEQIFSGSIGPIDVLKVGHHGSVSSTSTSLINNIKPRIGIISVGTNNRYGHPHPVILDRLQKQQVQLLRTDREGDILLTTDGGEPVVRPHPLLF